MDLIVYDTPESDYPASLVSVTVPDAAVQEICDNLLRECIIPPAVSRPWGLHSSEKIFAVSISRPENNGLWAKAGFKTDVEASPSEPYLVLPSSDLLPNRRLMLPESIQMRRDPTNPDAITGKIVSLFSFDEQSGCLLYIRLPDEMYFIQY
jgi:hypothetical protein